MPSIIYGCKHAILLQMALLPLTMARFTIASLSDLAFGRLIPLNRAVQMHIYLGYTMVALTFLATIGFFAFYGFLCAKGEQQFCDRFSSEIMITGYVIAAGTAIVSVTSYFRHQIPYEIFYVVHQSVLLIYGVTIAHTFDIVQRQGTTHRSQTFIWVSGSLLYYLCDRLACYLHNRYQVRVVSSTAVTGSGGSKMVILKLTKPTLFDFKAGQYAFLRIKTPALQWHIFSNAFVPMPVIDQYWHPFSIASGPDAPYLEFYIEVFDEHSWTGQLWKMLDEDEAGHFTVEVMGPMGTSLGKTDIFSHVIAIGTGTGK